MDCQNCVYFKQMTNNNGQCRLDPPVVVQTSYTGPVNSVWPIVKIDDWCGQFEITDAKRKEDLGRFISYIGRGVRPVGEIMDELRNEIIDIEIDMEANNDSTDASPRGSSE